MDMRPPKRSWINDDDDMRRKQWRVQNHWEQAIQNEIDSLVRNNTWDVVDLKIWYENYWIKVGKENETW
ncbi:uncharacterized protein PHALS_04788 [Plasmopara halstedii]|uniref:Uncharacterized protein n=1 Tax=Plasmopara halstedii TaxID=4781 RepID=A0A0P1B153_PLAHL|nr:uncharacterized protein PHALS_04788 [Plasmopara halstedii]CEG47640.1 hypothetical protein PHALS_04788 [Plasmopara halstedii]|eukprot:XP_024584009.1 hypothetical protein PHALS_04788 [Plasmopara halstedii]